MTDYFTNAPSRKPNESGSTPIGCLSPGSVQKHGPPCESNEIAINLQNRAQESAQGSDMDTIPKSAHQPDSSAISGFNAAYNRYDDYRKKRRQETAWPFNPTALELHSIWLLPSGEPSWSQGAEALRSLRIWAGGLAHRTAVSIGLKPENPARIMQEACNEAEAAGRYFADTEAAVEGQKWREGIPENVNLGTLAGFVFEPGNDWSGGTAETGGKVLWINIFSGEANVQISETSPQIRDLLRESFEKGRSSAKMTVRRHLTI